jgi:branched-chain amino acid transport system substrate-binding protein
MLATLAILAPVPAMPGSASAQTQPLSGEPIKIGYGISQTGGLAPNGKSALLAQKIWEEDVNAKGGVLGRPVKLVYFDDQSNPTVVPGIYTKLLDIDKVDLIIGGYGTNMLAPAMPVAMAKKKMLIGLFGIAVNAEFNYPSYFSMVPLGPAPKQALTKGFFEVAAAQNPKPQTVAIAHTDAEHSVNCAEGARENAAMNGLTVVYHKGYPPTTVDFAPIVRAIQAAAPELLVICSYPTDSAGMVKAVNEVGFKPKMIGGGMVGLQATVFKTQLGPLLNGFVNYDFWLPIPSMNTPAVDDFMKRYQARATAEGVDPFGYYVAPWAYAQLQVLQQAVAATKSLDDGKLADHMHAATFTTVVGDVRFGGNGEWTESRVLQVQFQNIRGNAVDQFKDLSTQVVVAPREYVSGRMIWPYEFARK